MWMRMISGMWGLLPKMVKVKGDKFLGTEENRNKWQNLGTDEVLYNNTILDNYKYKIK